MPLIVDSNPAPKCALCLTPCVTRKDKLSYTMQSAFPLVCEYLLPTYCPRCIFNIYAIGRLECMITENEFEFTRMCSKIMEIVIHSEKTYHGQTSHMCQEWKSLYSVVRMRDLSISSFMQLVKDCNLTRKYIFPEKLADVLERGGFSFGPGSAFIKKYTYGIWRRIKRYEQEIVLHGGDRDNEEDTYYSSENSDTDFEYDTDIDYESDNSDSESYTSESD